MAEFFANLSSNLTIQWTDLVDIAIVAFLIYKVYVFINETRAEQLVKGIVFLLAATYLSGIFHLHALNYILKGIVTFGAVALIIVFQPELRRALEYIGRGKILSHKSHVDREEARRTVLAICHAARYFSDEKVGALIAFERQTNLNDIAESGVELNARITEELLGTIFYVGTPLHDGALIIRGTTALAAGCVLPLTQDITLGKELGTRHRAAIGLSENSDALILVVSEETGIISLAADGKLKRRVSDKTLQKTLMKLYVAGEETDRESGALKSFGARFRKLIKRENVLEGEEEQDEKEAQDEE